MLTHQEKIEAITAACVKVNPEIVELKFGCRIESAIHGAGIILKEIPFEGESSSYVVRWTEKDAFMQMPNMMWEIIGRPVGIGDVLLAACKVSERIEGQLFVSDIGMFCIAKVGKSLDGLGYWNLLKPLHEQDEQTIDFIWSLLTPNSSKERV
jgi:hypothetical protein